MHKNNAILIYLLVVIIAAGCATLDSVRTQNRENLVRLQIGMTKSEVLDLMGTKTIHTWPSVFTWYTCIYFIPPLPTGKINNPFSSEIVQMGNDTWEILTYYTDRKKVDGALTDDEMTPLVFQNGKLIGWGWRFLSDVEARYEIRFR